MTYAISVHNLCKTFGETRALRGLSLDVESGDVYGFLGPNGAGKTTTLRILATLLRPDGGSASILGFDVLRQAKDVRPRIGFMPDQSGVYRDMKAYEYLGFFAAAYRVPAVKRLGVVHDCIELVGLTDKKHEFIEGLSRGMRQRLSLARCLINDPEVLLLDEPASGLDPRARLEIQEILRTLGSMGKTVLISSHILSELHQLCNKIGIIEEGKLIYSGTIDDALARARTARRVEVRLVDGAEEARDLLADRPEVHDVYIENGRIIVELPEGLDDFSFMAEVLIGTGYRILTISEEEVLLEDAFIKLTDGDGSVS